VNNETSRVVGIYAALKEKLARLPFVYYVLPPITWMLLIFVFSAQSTLPRAADSLLDLLIKKGLHMLAYAILLLLWHRALAAKPRAFAPLAVAWVLTVLYAASDEFHQTFVPGRSGRALDVVVDASGASLAVLSIWLARRRS
jgi:VanZ family protein